MFFSESNGWISGAIVFVGRYFLITGLAYYVFYIWKKKKWSHLKIQQKSQDKKQLQNDIFYSSLTLVLYNIAALILFWWYQKGITRIYIDINEYGIVYLVASVGLMVIMHDTYFYWTHKLMHRSSWLYQFHAIHHRAHQPTPWSAFAFHPVESVISLGIIPLIVFSIPTHPLALMLFITIMTIYNIWVHLGYRLTSKNGKPFFGKWYNTSTNHDLHHQGSAVNYGFYFTAWDKIMLTFKEADADKPA